MSNEKLANINEEIHNLRQANDKAKTEINLHIGCGTAYYVKMIKSDNEFVQNRINELKGLIAINDDKITNLYKEYDLIQKEYSLELLKEHFSKAI